VASESDDFDLNAAWLRRSRDDLHGYVAALAERLRGALPERVTVEHQRDGLLSSKSHVSKLTVQGEHAVFVLSFEKGVVSTRRVKQVRGVTLSSTTMKPPDWLRELAKEIAALSEDQTAASRAMYDFL